MLCASDLTKTASSGPGANLSGATFLSDLVCDGFSAPVTIFCFRGKDAENSAIAGGAGRGVEKGLDPVGVMESCADGDDFAACCRLKWNKFNHRVEAWNRISVFVNSSPGII